MHHLLIVPSNPLKFSISLLSEIKATELGVSRVETERIQNALTETQQKIDQLERERGSSNDINTLRRELEQVEIFLHHFMLRKLIHVSIICKSFHYRHDIQTQHERTTLKASIAELSSCNLQLQEDVKASEVNSARSFAEIESLRTQVKELKADVVDRETSLDEIKRMVDRLKETNKGLEVELAKSEQVRQHFEAEYSLKSEALKKLNETVSTLQEDLAVSRSDADVLRKDLSLRDDFEKSTSIIEDELKAIHRSVSEKGGDMLRNMYQESIDTLVALAAEKVANDLLLENHEALLERHTEVRTMHNHSLRSYALICFSSIIWSYCLGGESTFVTRAFDIETRIRTIGEERKHRFSRKTLCRTA